MRRECPIPTPHRSLIVTARIRAHGGEVRLHFRPTHRTCDCILPRCWPDTTDGPFLVRIDSRPERGPAGSSSHGAGPKGAFSRMEANPRKAPRYSQVGERLHAWIPQCLTRAENEI